MGVPLDPRPEPLPDPFGPQDVAALQGVVGERGGGAHTETQRGRATDGLWTEACGRQTQSNDPGNNQHIPQHANSIRQLNTPTQYANYWAPLTHKRHTNATSSTAPAHQRRGSANAETTPAGAPAAAADRTQRPDATRGGTNG